MTDNDTLTQDEVAVLARISKATVSRLTKAGKIPHARLSERIIRYQRSEIEAWIKGRNKTEAANGQPDLR